MSETLKIELEREFDGNNILIALGDVAKYKDLALRIKESFDDPTIVFRIKKQPNYIREPYRSSQVELIHRGGSKIFDTIASLEIDKHKSYQKLELKIMKTYEIIEVLPIITDYFDSVNKHLISSFKK